MISAATSPAGPRLVACIVAGDGPHRVAPDSSLTASVAQLSLADELALCLDTLEEDRERFEHAATRWHVRWCSNIADLTLVDAHTALTALESLGGPNGSDAARVLRYLCARHGQRGTCAVLARWIEHQARGMASRHSPDAGCAG
jgi:hypothetical protein